MQNLDTNRGQEATPLVIDGVMYVSTAWSMVKAFDAKSGALLWSYDPAVPRALGVRGCCDVVNRGVAAWKGKIYVGTFDGRLVALDARTGRQIWSVMTVEETLTPSTVIWKAPAQCKHLSAVTCLHLSVYVAPGRPKTNSNRVNLIPLLTALSLLHHFVAPGFTTIVPLIDLPWILQWYLNSPSFILIPNGGGYVLPLWIAWILWRVVRVEADVA